MALVTGGELLIRTLEKAGVEAIFGLHGAHIDTVFQACLDHRLRLIDTRHEAAAGHAAEGYARAGNRLGVALVTAGGGFTNVVTPLANAFMDRTPILVITGSGAVGESETNTLQAGLDQVAIATPLTKWAYRVLVTDQIPRLIAQAIRIATAGPRGPVLIDIPWDVLRQEVDDQEITIPEMNCALNGAQPHPALTMQALDILEAAARPAIIVGSEVNRGRGHAALSRFVRQTGIPAFADFEGFSVLAGLGDYSGGLIQNLYTFKEARPDAVLLLGVRFGLQTWHGSGLLIPRDAKIIQIDPDARESGRLQPISLPIVADPAASLEALAAGALNRDWVDHRAWRAAVHRIVAARWSRIEANAHDRTPIHTFKAVQKIAEFIDRDTIVVADGAESYTWLTEVMSSTDPAGFLTHGYLGCMGVGMGNALGAQVSAPDKRVLFVVGDGSVGYSLAEFDSLIRHALPVVVIVLNNRSWGATLHFQEFVAGPNRITNTRLDNGDYEAAAAAFGAGGYYVETVEQLDAALRAALASTRASCLNVRVDIDAIPPEELVLMGQDPFAESIEEGQKHEDGGSIQRG